MGFEIRRFEITDKMKKPIEWEKIFTNDAPEDGLISKIYKQLMQLKSKKPTTQLKNGQKSYTNVSLKKHTDGQKAHEKMFNMSNY